MARATIPSATACPTAARSCGSSRRRASPEEAAAVVAALERFMRDTAPHARPAAPRRNPWLRAALLEADRAASPTAPRRGATPNPWG